MPVCPVLYVGSITAPHEEQTEPKFRRDRQPWSRTIFAAKIIFLPPMFLGAAAAVVYGAIWVSFSPPRQKLIGVGLLVGAFIVMVLAMWLALDRPRQWFAPGVNDEPIPGRRLPRWFRKRRASFKE